MAIEEIAAETDVLKKPEVKVETDRIVSESQEAITTAILKYGSLLDESTLLGMIQGAAFERIALDFIELHRIGYDSLDDKRQKLILENIRAKSIRNPDGIIARSGIEIYGVFEVKLDPIRDTNYRVSDQIKHFGENIWDAVQELRQQGKLDEITVVNPEEIKIVVIHPRSAKNEYVEMEIEELSSGVLKGTKKGRSDIEYIFIPITKQEIVAFAKTIKDRVVDGLTDDVKCWIVPDEWVD
ncbi:MAG: hypothetical protein UX08_C0012G0017 [Candidatus Collierbacteria bacterium GW2011_GWB1_45_35]|uniref:Uncharacterized protein n=1 Tax=Candidatus Collierbacteria bacterium GW2011_GWB2_45_17 TaxID=1618388 RepID=A0A837IIU2_9BACT|nr:MAG: hypothetical protein UW48_C0001G0123 [Microgenomates group bacterium GW2011_GWC1_44_23]KKT96243.1 MAG: hypothetical protein UW96_C0001G0121 [Candidatus Collierbacteria bacterium GW2011_GWA1_45_15]KKU01283.1 MAG: hypothetical protein UX01_C0001G0127 [Candidatus Collierbacteria bacterium GW2011_GWB2_45_17]KKU04984.1 MAG: hypothetical protein UX08_C0012G0017 [Candidatus Collierbacteria bacterium GW2011_GWB1_45_35]HBC44994.1 hypothetical protein [Candidatus Collierbacteria bacterium]